MKVFLLRSGELELALDAGDVDRVLEVPQLFRLPQVPEPFYGVCLVEQAPIPVMYPGVPGAVGAQVDYLVVLQTICGRVGLPVSELPRVVDGQPAECSETEDSPAGWQVGWVEHRGKRWPLLNIGRLLPVPCS